MNIKVFTDSNNLRCTPCDVSQLIICDYLNAATLFYDNFHTQNQNSKNIENTFIYRLWLSVAIFTPR